MPTSLIAVIWSYLAEQSCTTVVQLSAQAGQINEYFEEEKPSDHHISWPVSSHKWYGLTPEQRQQGARA